MSDPTPTLTAEQRVASVLAAHQWGDDTAQVGHHAMQCGCGWKDYETGSIYALRARHDQHRAEAIARMVADAEQRGRAEVSAAVEAVAEEWQGELDSGAIRDETARYCWQTATRELRAILDGDSRVCSDLDCPMHGPRLRAALTDPAAAVARIKAEALREWIAEWPTTEGDMTFLADVARDGLHRADRIGGGDRRWRMTILSPPVLHRLDLACKHIREVFGGFNGPYLVGSTQERSAGPGSDVDLRLILDDEVYDALMAGAPDGFATLLDFALSAYVREMTGLPIDFQVQRMTEANARHSGKQRNPLGGRSLTNWVGDARPEIQP